MPETQNFDVNVTFAKISGSTLKCYLCLEDDYGFNEENYLWLCSSVVKLECSSCHESNEVSK